MFLDFDGIKRKPRGNSLRHFESAQNPHRKTWGSNPAVSPLVKMWYSIMKKRNRRIWENGHQRWKFCRESSATSHSNHLNFPFATSVPSAVFFGLNRCERFAEEDCSDSGRQPLGGNQPAGREPLHQDVHQHPNHRHLLHRWPVVHREHSGRPPVHGTHSPQLLVLHAWIMSERNGRGFDQGRHHSSGAARRRQRRHMEIVLTRCQSIPSTIQRSALPSCECWVKWWSGRSFSKNALSFTKAESKALKICQRRIFSLYWNPAEPSKVGNGQEDQLRADSAERRRPQDVVDQGADKRRAADSGNSTVKRRCDQFSMTDKTNCRSD